MNKKNININLYILIPTIFSGITIIFVILSYQIAGHYNQLKTGLNFPIILLVAAGAVCTFICSLLIIRIILNPVIRFVKKAEALPVMPKHSEMNNHAGSPVNIEHMSRVLDHITTILDKVEAKELFPEIIGESRAMRALFGQIMKAAPTNSTVLITGETGTGKELAAKSIHKHSLRFEKPLININCVAIPEGLLESELFGHEKGSFTGADKQKKGKFELADGGTIFLDEIGDMPLATQAKILRVLEEREFERVGGTSRISVDVRILAATNKNLQEMVRTGAFREDLFYRLNVFAFHLPPLRERREDIPFLIEHFLKQMGKECEVSQEAMQILLWYPWPGNIRELKNTIERAAVIAEGAIKPGHLPAYLAGDYHVESGRKGNDLSQSIDQRLAEMEKAIIIETLNHTGGVQTKAAQILGINQRSLWHRIKKYQIDVASFKN
ncbi:MAG: sigma-54-dependent Fis family transcriptional regulator [Syntrophaceae bacterium]|nr:sigma-54-dependent Fis family transcriptional regulator [Syntrophaceae bacterium]